MLPTLPPSLPPGLLLDQALGQTAQSVETFDTVSFGIRSSDLWTLRWSAPLGGCARYRREDRDGGLVGFLARAGVGTPEMVREATAPERSLKAVQMRLSELAEWGVLYGGRVRNAHYNWPQRVYALTPLALRAFPHETRSVLTDARGAIAGRHSRRRWEQTLGQLRVVAACMRVARERPDAVVDWKVAGVPPFPSGEGLRLWGHLHGGRVDLAHGARMLKSAHAVIRVRGCEHREVRLFVLYSRAGVFPLADVDAFLTAWHRSAPSLRAPEIQTAFLLLTDDVRQLEVALDQGRRKLTATWSHADGTEIHPGRSRTLFADIGTFAQRKLEVHRVEKEFGDKSPGSSWERLSLFAERGRFTSAAGSVVAR